ncbi:MAG: hypothetical protein IOC84_13510 [Rhodobacter sp.]|nr:hypothetical protein [Rhodobacter sp.]
MRKTLLMRRGSFTSRPGNFSRVLSPESRAVGALRRRASSRHHQRRGPAAVQPILPAIGVSAARSDARSDRCPSATRTARPQRSGENPFVALLMIQAPSGDPEPPQDPGRFMEQDTRHFALTLDRVPQRESSCGILLA